ncbi:MAG: ketoacyl-ACP synthase III, partial [Bradymonadaceae bacterium]
MQQFLSLHIAGIGRYLPERIVENAELEELCHLCDGEIAQTGAGVTERRWVTTETNSTMGAAAAREAVADAGLELEEIDLILNASGTAEQV